MSSRPRILAAIAAAVALAAGAARAEAGTIVTFDFRRGTNTSSLLTIYRQDLLDGRILNQASYRAGSGLDRNECDSAAYDGVGGWLPAGYYNLWGHFHHYTGTLIQGRVWRLQDKRCRGGTGTLRTELFIHSEETYTNQQACGSPYIERFCWDNDGDYYSVGCIKISRNSSSPPADLGRLDANWDQWSGLTGSFNLSQRLYVS
jgi:hypothetical protein